MPEELTPTLAEDGPRPREVAKQRTREELILAGIAEFAEHGFDAPSLDAICARAGRTRGAFYVHFEDRDAFVLAVVDRVLGSFLDAMIDTEAGAQNLKHTIRRFARLVVGFQQVGLAARAGRAAEPGWEVLALHRVLEACARSARIRERFASILGEAIERVAALAAGGPEGAAVRADVDPHGVATLLVSIALGATVALETGADFDAARAGDTLLALLAPARPPARGSRR